MSRDGWTDEARLVASASSPTRASVEDAGPTPTLVLEPFYGKQENGMLGLGLALVDRIARAHGGRAIAENREGGGARMGLVLPLSREASDGAPAAG